MKRENSNILISGASVAGPVLAYWLRRHGFRPTVVERAPTLRRTGGHAVDLFRPAVEVIERMGMEPQVRSLRTRNDRLSVIRGAGKPPIDLDLDVLLGQAAEQHVEIMRDDLSELLYERTHDDVEYIFGDSICSMDEDDTGVTVSFEHAAPRRFHLVVGADGLHSNVRRLTFGAESEFTSYLGAYLAVFSLPNYLGLTDRVLVYNGVGRTVAVYRAGDHPEHPAGEARAVLVFRRTEPLRYNHRDIAQQKELLRREFATDEWELPRLLTEAAKASTFYFDSISQVELDGWSRGRVTLVGDAGYCPGPAVGGGTSLAIVGAYVLAGELAMATGQHVPAFANYERELQPYVARIRDVARTMVRRIPNSPLAVWRITQQARMVNRLPAGLLRTLAGLDAKAAPAHNSVRLTGYRIG